MKHEKKFLCVIFLCMFLSPFSMGQETITSTGGNAIGSGGTVSYTVGQTVYMTFSGSNGSIAQGVQQPYEISVVTAVKNIEGISLECSVYPNPTGGLFRLIVKSPDYDNLRFFLLDNRGLLINDKPIEGKETTISMEELPSSVYFLKVISKNLEVKVFKIIKN